MFVLQKSGNNVQKLFSIKTIFYNCFKKHYQTYPNSSKILHINLDFEKGFLTL